MSIKQGTEQWREDWAMAPVDEAGVPEALGIASEIMDVMEQGIVVWSAAGLCDLHNARVFDVLGLEGGDLGAGMSRDAFRARLHDLGVAIDPEAEAMAGQRIAERLPYTLDFNLPDGRVVRASARPTQSGGYVVSLSDVTDVRRAARDLVAAQEEMQAVEERASRVLAHERARQTEQSQLSTLDEWLQSCKTLDELYMIVTRFMGRVMTGTEGELYTFSGSRDVLDGVGSWATGSLHSDIAPDSCWALRRGRAYEYDPQGICFVCGHVDPAPDAEYPDEYVCVPVVAHGDTVGLMHVRFDPGVWRGQALAEKMRFTRQCAEHISMAIANVRLRDELHDQSIRDPLTGIYNRRHFMDAMRREMSIADRRGTPLGLISYDADKFKEFNDNHGHDAGDAVLRALANVALEVLAHGEICCRVGGEEFAVLLPGRTLAQTHAVALRLCEAVAAMGVRYGDGVLPQVTISAGVAEYPVSATKPEALIKRADEALYRAKQEGRNRVAGHDGAPDAAPPRRPARPEPWHEPAPASGTGVTDGPVARAVVPIGPLSGVPGDAVGDPPHLPTEPSSVGPGPDRPGTVAPRSVPDPSVAGTDRSRPPALPDAPTGASAPPAFLLGPVAAREGAQPPPRMSDPRSAAPPGPPTAPRSLGADPLPSRGPRPGGEA